MLNKPKITQEIVRNELGKSMPYEAWNIARKFGFKFDGFLYLDTLFQYLDDELLLTQVYYHIIELKKRL